MMPHLPGYYYDPDKNRYFKGKPPKPPPPPPPPPSLKPSSLPQLLHETALGQPTTQSQLHATLLHPSTPSTNPISPTSHNPQLSYSPTDTLAYKLPNSSLNLLTFPDNLLVSYRYHSAYPPNSITSYGNTVAYATNDGVYIHQIVDHRWIRRKYQLNNMTTVQLSSKYILMAGRDSSKLYPLINSIAPHPPTVCFPLRRVSASHLVDISTCALGLATGTVHYFQHGQLIVNFQPSEIQRSLVTALRITDNLIWCSTMNGGTNLSAWDVRDCKKPAIVCRGHSNVCKMVDIDVAGSLVIAGGDDDKVRLWDIRGGGVLSQFAVSGVVKRIKMVGWHGAYQGTCGVWLDTGDDIYARVVAR